MDWIIENRQWLFDGALVVLPIAILSWIFAKRQIQRSQTQKSGDNSLNIQVGGNIEIAREAGDDRPDSKSGR
jgi:hypothetical protein